MLVVGYLFRGSLMQFVQLKRREVIGLLGGAAVAWRLLRARSSLGLSFPQPRIT
jgi:hypothetical protein